MMITMNGPSNTGTTYLYPVSTTTFHNNISVHEIRTALTKIISLSLSLNVSTFTDDDGTFYDRIFVHFGYCVL